MRRPEPVTEAPAPQEQMFKLELPDAPPSTDAAAATDAPATAELQWKDLTPTEQSAASLGVDPAAWKPIAFMNTAHYDSLLKTNAIDGDLARRLEAFKHVAAGGK